jgi:hypothetical protein
MGIAYPSNTDTVPQYFPPKTEVEQSTLWKKKNAIKTHFPRWPMVSYHRARGVMKKVEKFIYQEPPMLLSVEETARRLGISPQRYTMGYRGKVNGHSLSNLNDGGESPYFLIVTWKI